MTKLKPRKKPTYSCTTWAPLIEADHAFGALEGQNYKKRKATALGEKLGPILAKMVIFPIKEAMQWLWLPRWEVEVDVVAP